MKIADSGQKLQKSADILRKSLLISLLLEIRAKSSLDLRLVFSCPDLCMYVVKEI
ncbi:MAG TPA: hypothetical protein VGH00_06525 [Chthoniobacterales bacterium]